MTFSVFLFFIFWEHGEYIVNNNDREREREFRVECDEITMLDESGAAPKHYLCYMYKTTELIVLGLQ